MPEFGCGGRFYSERTFCVREFFTFKTLFSLKFLHCFTTYILQHFVLYTVVFPYSFKCTTVGFSFSLHNRSSTRTRSRLDVNFNRDETDRRQQTAKCKVGNGKRKQKRCTKLRLRVMQCVPSKGSISQSQKSKTTKRKATDTQTGMFFFYFFWSLRFIFVFLQTNRQDLRPRGIHTLSRARNTKTRFFLGSQECSSPTQKAPLGGETVDNSRKRTSDSIDGQPITVGAVLSSVGKLPGRNPG